jgi:hypothetical protein
VSEERAGSAVPTTLPANAVNEDTERPQMCGGGGGGGVGGGGGGGGGGQRHVLFDQGTIGRSRSCSLYIANFRAKPDVSRLHARVVESHTLKAP